MMDSFLSRVNSDVPFAPKDVRMKNRIKALHDWYDRCAIKRSHDVKKSLRNKTLHDSRTNNWLKKRAPRRAVVQMRAEQRRSEAKLWFESLDFDGSGEISVAELKKPLIAMGFAKSVQEVQDLVDSVDDDGSGEIGFEEFLAVLGGGVKSKRSGQASLPMETGEQTLGQLDPKGSVSSTTSSLRSRSGGGGGGKGGAIKKLHTQLESGELGDTTNMELETLLVSYQRSVLTDALFSRGYRAKGMNQQEKREHQRTVDALYDSYVHDREVQAAEEKAKKRSEAQKAKRMKQTKQTTGSPEEPAQILDADEKEHHQHNHKTHEYIPKGGRLKPSLTMKGLEKRLVKAGRHVHSMGDMRDHYRDEMMIERLKEDTHNKSLHAPWTRSSMGFNTDVPTKTKEQKMNEMRRDRREAENARVSSIPAGRNSVLHKLLIGRPLATDSYVPSVRKLVPIKVSLNSAFLSAKRSKMLRTPTTDFFRTQKRHERLKTFQERNVAISD